MPTRAGKGEYHGQAGARLKLLSERGNHLERCLGRLAFGGEGKIIIGEVDCHVAAVGDGQAGGHGLAI